MKSTLVLLGPFLVLLCMSEAQTEVLVQPNFDAKKFSGLWYVVAMVSDCKVFLGKKDHLLMSTRTIQTKEDGSLHFHMEFPRVDGCNQVDTEYLKVGSDGHFRAPALGYLDVRVADTDYSSFAVVYIYKELEGVLSTMVQLYSRTQDASPEAMKAFQDFYPTVGLHDDMMAKLPKSGSPELEPLTPLTPLTKAVSLALQEPSFCASPHCHMSLWASSLLPAIRAQADQSTAWPCAPKLGPHLYATRCCLTPQPQAKHPCLVPQVLALPAEARLLLTLHDAA
ncbi:PREDICTED: lipocalin-15 [Elephantulus edwardii]|uniref:lipocalin-15 n=1 Tax=Elephantulus edwardii TaxID=28737 RepID=UPI0003F07F20|nr:PREDICTED: lipocalin-15 [Elephantulus edwardii]